MAEQLTDRTNPVNRILIQKNNFKPEAIRKIDANGEIIGVTGLNTYL